LSTLKELLSPSPAESNGIVQLRHVPPDDVGAWATHRRARNVRASLERGFLSIGSQKYEISSRNCQHFAEWWVNRSPYSLQSLVIFFGLMALGSCFLLNFFGFGHRRKTIQMPDRSFTSGLLNRVDQACVLGLGMLLSMPLVILPFLSIDLMTWALRGNPFEHAHSSMEYSFTYLMQRVVTLCMLALVGKFAHDNLAFHPKRRNRADLDDNEEALLSALQQHCEDSVRIDEVVISALILLEANRYGAVDEAHV